jgi:hypothetical protein
MCLQGRCLGVLVAVGLAALCGCQHQAHGARKLTITFGSPFSITVEDRVENDETGTPNYSAMDKVTPDPLVNWLFSSPPEIPEPSVTTVVSVETDDSAASDAPPPVTELRPAPETDP